ncbi:GNAT family N-acetyltransferase [Rhodospirillaceae bacterium KN72]|uniref:GNAT family N-acetyltransferase n=1 Tax=Pacificispira spongiicola TaxID=2729598 RepID=A0A7Y0DZ03_9PROT|nr:GNAT family N-acetyltransferase [Pacificispira spongiicola]NMM44204.1 GNAT family N-acetyltransferase [Pacificispira spongiicola]
MATPDSLIFRDARPEDLAALLDIMADDGKSPEPVPFDANDPCHRAALEEIDASPSDRLIVVERDGAIVATFHPTIIPSFGPKAAKRLLLEAVFVHKDFRGAGIGAEILRWTEDWAATNECRLIVLTSDRIRDGRAKRFYESHGFAHTHFGMRKRL